MKADKTHGAIAARKNKAGKLNVLVFQPEGGAPYTVEVMPQDTLFELPGSTLTYKITRGSVWIEGGTARTCVNADNPQTINISTLTGNDIFSPQVLNGIAENNLAEQVTRAAQVKPMWQRGATWGILGMGLIMGLLMFWLVKTLGSGMEELRNAIDGLQITFETARSSSTAAGGGATGAGTAGHQPIAPGGV